MHNFPSVRARLEHILLDGYVLVSAHKMHTMCHPTLSVAHINPVTGYSKG